jgi:hypothetical protein
MEYNFAYLNSGVATSGRATSGTAAAAGSAEADFTQPSGSGSSRSRQPPQGLLAGLPPTPLTDADVVAILGDSLPLGPEATAPQGAHGGAQAAGLIPPPPYGQAVAPMRAGITTELAAVAQGMRQLDDRVFNRLSSIVSQSADYDEINRLIEQNGGVNLDNDVTQLRDRIVTLRLQIPKQWSEQRNDARAMLRQCDGYLQILEDAWNRNRANPEWEQPN